jgi:hypothetical protein
MIVQCVRRKEGDPGDGSRQTLFFPRHLTFRVVGVRSRLPHEPLPPVTWANGGQA